MALEKLCKGTNHIDTHNRQMNPYFACLKLSKEKEMKTYIEGLRHIRKYVWLMNPKTLRYAQELAFRGELLEEEEEKEANIVQVSFQPQPHTPYQSQPPYQTHHQNNQPPRYHSHDPSPGYRSENQALHR